MDNENTFSGIPALEDTQGLQNYLNQESLREAGLAGGNPPAEPNGNANDTGVDNGQPAQPVSYTSEQVAQLISEINALKAQIANPQPQPQVQPQQNPAQPQVQKQPTAGYTAQQKQFITEALGRGYSLEAILEVINKKSSENQIVQRMNNLENYMKEQEYKRAEAEFVNRLSSFGNKWGLSESDLVTFGNAALQKGINIAHVTDLEAVFRAVYPEQYAIRLQRMSNTNTSQIYGGTSIPESSRVAAAKAEDAYVDAFFKSTMPNQYNQFNKK